MSELNTKITNLGISYGLPPDWLINNPKLFSPTQISLTAQQIQQMHEVVAAVETVVQLPAYQEKVLSWAAPIAAFKPKAHGLFFSYDFHLTPAGVKLIEINTNASGATFTALLELAKTDSDPGKWEKEFCAMFFAEWRRQGRDFPLRRIAIVDENPTQQNMYNEFLLFQRLLKNNDVDVVIVDPVELHLKNNKVYVNDLQIDLIYNRLTDFYLIDPQHAVLKQAYLDDAVVLTPHPHAYALYADKRNFTVLSNENLLVEWGVSETVRQQLHAAIPRTILVNPADATTLWAERKSLFFKPISGYGGKGVYRGLNLTRGVFAEILDHDYIAQALVPPSTHSFTMDGETFYLKVDIRNYVDNRQVFSTIARLYQGQTTNLRTVGGGFAWCS